MRVRETERIRFVIPGKLTEYDNMNVCMCAFVCAVHVCISAQDPPNAELVCKVNGVSTTTAVTIRSPVLMTDESGAMTLTYDIELLGMARGGPTVFNTTASVESVDEEELVCDDGIGVSLFIDNVGRTSTTGRGCGSAMITP